MKLTVTNPQGDVAVLDVTPETSMDQLAAKVEEAFRIPVRQQQVFFKNNIIPRTGTVNSHGMQQDDMLLVTRRENVGIPASQPSAPSSSSTDMMSLDAQRRIEEEIRQQNVQHNMAQAIEHNPEGFASVVMLFVDCKINGVPAKAFVDSGAQATIISRDCAERCNILRLLDKRFEGIARGVGTAKIHGRIHICPLHIGTEFFHCTFLVVDSVGGGYDMLLGLDMLRKHQGTIDLKDNVLRMGNSAVPFLPEKDIPRSMLEQGPDETPSRQAPSVPAPSGRQSGTTNEAAVSRLVELGFTRNEAVQALRASGGNADQAAAMLTQARYGF